MTVTYWFLVDFIDTDGSDAYQACTYEIKAQPLAEMKAFRAVLIHFAARGKRVQLVTIVDGATCLEDAQYVAEHGLKPGLYTRTMPAKFMPEGVCFNV